MPDSRARALDGLRGLAACSVVIFHAILNNDLSLVDPVLVMPWQDCASLRDAVTKAALLVFNGKAAVTVFFVLSGCVLRLSLDRHRGDAGPVLSLRFGLARLVRLYPPVIACMLLFYGISLVGIAGYPRFSQANLVHNSLLWSVDMHGPSLTIQAEVLAVPFILIAFLLRRHFGIVGLGIVSVYGLLANEALWLTLRLPAMSVYLPPILLGMVLPERTLARFFRGGSPNGWWAAFACALLSQAFVPHGWVSGVIASNFAAALLIGGLLHGRRGSLHRMLERPTAQFLGRISFSFYLLNVPVLDLFWAFTNGRAWPKQHALESGLVTGALAIIATVPLAWASERFIERPSVAAGRLIWSAFRRNSGENVHRGEVGRGNLLSPFRGSEI